MTDRPVWLLDDATIHALVEGQEVPARFAPLAAFATAVQAAGDRPAPPPSAELAALLGGAPPRSPRLGLVTKVAVGGVAVAVALAGATAADVLPPPVTDAVRDVIEVVTPVEFDDPAPSRTESPAPAPSTSTSTSTTEASTTIVPAATSPAEVGQAPPPTPDPVETGNPQGVPPQVTAPAVPSPAVETQSPQSPGSSPAPTAPAPTLAPTDPPPPPTTVDRPHPTHPSHPTHPPQASNPPTSPGQSKKTSTSTER